jgi:hypothetical protein
MDIWMEKELSKLNFKAANEGMKWKEIIKEKICLKEISSSIIIIM